MAEIERVCASSDVNRLNAFFHFILDIWLRLCAPLGNYANELENLLCSGMCGSHFIVMLCKVIYVLQFVVHRLYTFECTTIKWTIIHAWS